MFLTNRLVILRLILLVLALVFPMSMSEAAPSLTGFFPTGAKVGSKTEITVFGSFENWPVSFWCSNPEIKIVPNAKKGSVTLEVSTKAQSGPCWIRAHDTKGFSPEKVFFLGNLIEATETEPNDLPSRPQKIAGPTVLSGKLQKAGDVDCFSFPLKKGETFVASVVANRFLQAPMDAILQVVSRDGFVMAQDHDENKLDPEIVFKAPETGEFILRVFAFPSTPDSTIRFAGGDSYIYRLTLTNGPFPIAPWPLAFGAKEKGKVGLKGWNLQSDEHFPVNTSNFPGESDLLSRPAWGQSVSLLRPNEKSVVFDQTVKNIPQTIPVSFSLKSGWNRQPNTFTFNANKGKSLEIQAKSGSLGWLMNPVLRIRDEKGTLVQTLEPGALHKDTEGVFTPKTDGKYTMEISDLFGHSSPRHICHLILREALPDWDLKSEVDSVKLEGEKTAELTLSFLSKNGFKDLIELEAVGLPEGMKMTRKDQGKTVEKTITLIFSSKLNSKPGSFQLWAWAKGNPGAKRRVMISQENLPNRADFWIQSIPTDPPKSK